MNTSPLDEDRLQHLVDGALDSTERRNFLLEADQHPHWWREIALAFVEDQVFTECVTSRSKTDLAPSRTSSRIFWSQLSLYAACLALAGSVGYLMGPSPDTAIDQVTAEASEVDQSIPPYTVTLRDEFGGEEESIEVPAYDATQLTAFLNGLQTNASLKQANEDLKVHGYRINWDTHFLSGELQDGGKVLLPVSTLDLQYQGQ